MDAAAGRLAKWLRILGFDATYFRGERAQELMSRAIKERRVALTRNKELHKENPSGVILLRSEALSEQIRQVVDELDLKEKIRPFSRCSVCNTPLKPRSREEAKGNVPFFVYQTQKRFGYCPKCGKFYWEGTHYKEMVKELEKLGC